MDVRDGLIVGISNYCDRWCERCAFTSRCELFADVAAHEAALDPALGALVDAPPLPQDIPPPPPKWMQDLLENMNRATNEALSDERIEKYQPRILPEHQDLYERAHEYCRRVHHWFGARECFGVRDTRDPRAVVEWFHTTIPAKIYRALTGLARDVPEERDWPPDHDGSAKVALLGIEQSHAAWLDLVEEGVALNFEIHPFVADLVWLGDEVQRVFPGARAFVRPAFDEPDEVARLRAAETRR